MRKTGTRLLAVLLAVVMVLPSVLIPGMAAEATGFTDVPEGSWYEDAVNYVSEKGYMAGVGDNKFAPNDEVTRAMFVTILARITMAETDGTVSAFTDVPENKWYTGAVNWAAENGIVNGVGDGMFAPGKSITRQDLCTILYRFVNAMDYELTVGEEKTFTDSASVSSYAAEAVRYASSVGLIAGYDDGTFRPKATATRAQMAVIIMRLARLLDGQIVKPEPMPAQYFEEQPSDEMKVTVNAPVGALPEDTEMTVTSVTDEDKLSAIAEMYGGDVLGAVDISFSKDGVELEPETDVNVLVSMNGLDPFLQPVVVHVSDDDEMEKVEGAKIVDTVENQKAVQFNSKDFSVYVILNQTVVEVNFYKGTEKINTQRVIKNNNDIGSIYDPGVDLEEYEVFLGWAIGSANGEQRPVDDENADDINDYIKANFNSLVSTGLNIYAVTSGVRYLVYVDEDGRVLKTDFAYTSSPTLDVDLDYVPKNGSNNHFGWYTMVDGQRVEYLTDDEDEDRITLTQDVTTLHPIVKGGVWLSFDGNKGSVDNTPVTFTESQFVVTGEKPEEPADPTRDGYTFRGWYNTAACAVGEEFDFTESLDANKTVYAKWEGNNNTPYRVIIWRQKSTDEVDFTNAQKNYDYYKTSAITELRYATTGSTVYPQAADQQLAGTTSSDMGYYFTYNAANSTQSAIVKGDGSTVLNIRYDRKVMTFNFYKSSNISEYNRYSWTGYDKVEPGTGTHYYYSPENPDGYYQLGTGPQSELPAAGTTIYYDEYVYQNLYYSNTNDFLVYLKELTSGARITYKGNYSGITWHDTYFSYVYGNVTYYCPVYYKYTNQYSEGYYPITTGPNTDAAGDYVQVTVNGQLKGLYNSKNYLWPVLGSGYVFSFNGYNFPLPVTQFVQQTTETETVLNFYRTSISGSACTIYYYGQNLDDENYYSLILQGTSYNGGTWYVTENVEGFTVAQYGYDGQNWSTCTRATPIDLNNYTAVYVLFTRNKWNLSFYSYNGMVQPAGLTGPIPYETDLSTYKDFVPTNGPAGYYFAGWYEDPGYVKKYDFDKMPDHDVMLYAKWSPMRFRVVIDPTGGDPSIGADEITFDDPNQKTTFKVTYGDPVEPGGIDSAKRTGWQLAGWYTDKNFTNRYNFDDVVTNTTTGMDMGYASLPAADRQGTAYPNQTYDDSGDDAQNVRGRLFIYARWRHVLDSGDYIQVVYDCTSTDNVTGTLNDAAQHTDPNHYADTAAAITLPAAKADVSGYTFKNWTLMAPTNQNDASTLIATDKVLNPGDTFDVLMDNAVISTEGDHKVYTVYLKASYRASSDTHITWVGNGGTTASGATYVNSPDAVMNTFINIMPSDTFTREGYMFLGWARLDESQYKENDTFKPYGGSDTWLTYSSDSGDYLYTANNTDYHVSQVAANEEPPYHIMYAVWAPIGCYVYHSATGMLEAIPASVTKLNLQEKVTPGYLYGGYYSDMAILDDTAVDTAKVKSGSYIKYMAPVEGAVKYDGSALRVGTVRFWDSTLAETVDGTNLTGNAITQGKVYYLKEVPANYLVSKIEYVYDRKHTEIQNEIVDMYLTTLVDDNLYNSIGFKHAGSDKISETSFKAYEKLVNRFTFVPWMEESNAETISAADFGMKRGYVAVNHFTQYANVGSFTMVPTWITKDGVEVCNNGLTITIGENKVKDDISWRRNYDGTERLLLNFSEVKRPNNTAASGYTYWLEGNALTKAYFSGPNGKTAWVTCSSTTDDGILSVVVPAGMWTGINFCRVNPNTPQETNWANFWNQTGEVNMVDENMNSTDNYISEFKDHYMMTQGEYAALAEQKTPVTWGTYLPLQVQENP